MSGGSTIRAPFAWVLLLAFSLTALWTWMLPMGRVVRGQNDFLAFYAGAKFAGTPELYSASAAKRLQGELAQTWLPAVIYIRPPFYAALLRPIAALPYRTAYLLFEGLNLAALGAFLWIWARRDPLLCILGGISIPIATAFANGQDILLLVWICATAWELDRRGKSFWSGIVFSLLAIKFHVFLFVPLALLFQRRWKTLAGGAIGTSMLFAIGAALQGWNWPVDYFRFLRTPEITPTGITMPNLRGLLMATIGDAARAELVLAVLVVVAFVYVSARIRDFGGALALAIVAGLLTSHHAYVQDCCLLLLVPVLAPGFGRTRAISFAVLAPPVYFLLVAGGVVSAVVPMGIAILFAAIAGEALFCKAEIGNGSFAQQFHEGLRHRVKSLLFAMNDSKRPV